MKRKITLLLAVAASVVQMQAQQVFSESFTAPFNPAAAGWNVQNLSAPVGSTSWFQGTTNQLTALSGAPADFFAANFNSTGATGANNTISTWLITPTLNLVNGAVIEFATRASTALFADRLQLYYSTAGTGTNVGTTAGTATNTAGTFTNILLDINPALTAQGYPRTWTIYTATLSGVVTPGPGRFAFRYYVTNGGNGGVNSNYIGIDDVNYSLPCAFPDFQLSQTSLSVCAGSSSTLSFNAAQAPTSYTWSVGTNTSPAVANPTANASPIAVSPTLNSIYILTAESTPGCYSKKLVTVSMGVPPVVQAQSYTVCSNPLTTLTLSASGAGTYLWDNGATTNSIVVTPNSTTVYTVTGTPAGSSCAAIKQVTVTLGNSLSVNVSSNAFTPTICSGQGVVLTATSAAASYLWSNGSTSSSIIVTPNVTTTYTVGGLLGACAGSNSITVSVNPSPTVNLVLTPSVVCAGVTHTLTATGAVSYSFDLNNPNPTWIAATTVTFVPNISPMFLFVLGVGANGCSDVEVLQPTVNPNPTVTAVAGKTLVCVGSVITLTASGANTYSWSGASSSTASPLSYQTGTVQGAYQFSVTGTSTVGCKNSAVVTVSVSKCTGWDESGLTSYAGAIFPNPFENNLRVTGIDGRVVMYNALGQIVLQSVVAGSCEMNTSALPAGMYILKVYDTQGNRERDIKLLKD